MRERCSGVVVHGLMIPFLRDRCIMGHEWCSGVAEFKSMIGRYIPQTDCRDQFRLFGN
jgi:hypothetical protein